MATPAATSTRTDDAVRKTVTVLFCDLAGSTALEERVDAESSRDILGRYHSMVESVVVASGGTIAKFIGDGAMALFGIPEVAVDDAERGVAAGLELQRRFLALRTHITGRFDVDVGLRVGVNTGEVVIADADADLVGDALNVAARIEAACAPGDVLVGEDTWRVTRAAVAYESFGMLELRGKQEAVAAYRAVDLLAEVDESATPFVGRDGELDRLRTVFDEAVTTSSVKLATVIGAPGVGKTRLSREFERALRDEATVIELRCERAGGTTFAPITDLLRIVGEIDDAMSADEAIERLTVLVDGLDDADRVGSLLASFTGATPMRSTEETFFAVRRLVESMGRQRPVAIVIDDIQWAEALFLDLLEHLAEWGRDSPALLLGLARPELREIRPSLAEVGRRVSESIALEGLDAEATAELAGLLVGTDSLPADLLARLPESTEGNPLFVRELMKMLIDDDVIVETDRGWELAIDADAVEVPPTIQSLLSSRIERMPDDERYLVELAAVVGPEFPLGAVAAIGASGDSGTLTATLERLRRKELVEPTGTYWGDEPLFRFHHVLIRDAAYRRLLKGRRADLHLRVAEWIENVGASDVGEQQVTVGYHLEQAHDYRTQLDIADEETVAIGRRAAEMLGAAAERALARDDVAAAGSLAVRAVARLNDNAEEREDLLMLGCEALFSLGDVAAAVPLLKELRGASAENARLAAWTRSFEAQLVLLTDPERLEEAERESATAAADLAALDDHAGEANARLVRAGALARLGRIGECEAELDSALGAARAADDGRRVAAVLGAAPVAALWGPSPVSRAGGRCLDVIRLLRITTGSPGVEATSTRCQAVLEALRGRFDTARTMLGEALATVEELGLRHGWLETQLYSGIVELLAGDPVAAEPHLRSAYGGLGRLGIGADAGQAAAHLSRALLLQGRLDEADELATDSEALAGQNPQTAIAAKTARAEILAARGEVDEALRLAEEAVALAEGTDIVIDHANANVALARVRAAAGDADGARTARRAAEALFTAKGASVDLGDLEAGTVSDISATAPTSAETEAKVSRAPVSQVEQAHEPWNRADALVRSVREGLTRDTVTANIAADIVFEGRRALHLARIDGRDDVLAMFDAFGTDDREGLHSEIETIAVRGENLVLWQKRQWAVEDPDGDVRSRLELDRINEAGHLDLAISFDEGDLADALAELDRLYLDDVDDLVVRSRVKLWNEGFQALGDGDTGGALAPLDAAYVQHDHRALGWGLQDRAHIGDRTRTLAELPADTVTYVARYFERHGRVEWVEVNLRVAGRHGAEQVDVRHVVDVLSAESGLVMRTDRYGDDQIDEARAKFNELSGAFARPTDLWNVALEAGQRVNTWARQLEWDRLRHWLSDSLVVEDSDGRSLIGLQSIPRDLDSAGSIGFGVEHRRVLAVRGERLVLAELRNEGADEPFHRIVVEEIDDDCLLARITHFAPAALADAALHLELRCLDLDGSCHGDVIRTVAELSHARAVADADRLRALLADDCRFADHRFPGLPGNDMSWLFDMIDAESADGSATTGVASQLLAVNGCGYLSVVQPWRIPASGPLEEHGLPILTIGRVTDDRVSALEFFPDDQFDAAHARFEELTGEPEVIDDEPWNAADALMRHMWPAIANRDNDSIAAMTTADIVRHDRRRLHGVTEQGRADTIAALGAFELGSSTFEVETIATRGDRLVLQRADHRDPDNNVLHGLNIARLDGDGLVDLDVTFDPEDMDAALAELDRLWSEADEADEVFWSLRRHWDAWAVHATEGAATGNWSHAMGYMDPGLEMVDHRSIGWPAVDYEGFRNRLDSVTAMDGTVEITVPVVHAIDGLVSAATMVMRLREPNGAEHVDRSVLVSTSSPESSQAISHEQFAGDDLEAAMRRFRAIVRDHADDRSMSNAATMASARAHRWVSLGLDPFETIIAPHAAIVNARGDALLEDRADLAAVRDAGLGTVEHRVLAVRGQRLGLVELRGSEAEDHRFAAVEIDERAWITQLTLFDGNTASLAAAADLLDERWLETEPGGPTDAQRFAVRWSRAYRRGPRAELDEIFASHALLTDRRPLGWEPIRYVDWVEVISGTEIEGLRGVPIVSEFHRISDDGLAVSSSHLDVTDDHELVEMLEGVHLATISDGRITAVDAWPSDDLDGALARLAELTQAPSAPAEHEPLNSADALARRMVAAQASGTIEVLADAIGPDCVIDDRRRLHHVVHRGPADCLASLANHPYGATERSVAVETIAIRGDRLALCRTTLYDSTDTAGPLLQTLSITRLTTAGTSDLGVIFDDEDLDAAMTELDRLWDELDETDEAFTFAELIWSQWEADANWAMKNELDFTRALAHQDQRLRLVDHREIGWPIVDFDGFKERLESFRAITASGEIAIPWLHAADGLVSLAVMQTHIVRSSGGEHVDRNVWLARLSPDTGQTIAMEQFPIEELPAAMTRFRELAIEQQRDAPLWNAASVAANRAHSWSRMGHPIAGIVATENVVVEDGDGTEFPIRGDLDDPDTARRLGFGVDHCRVLAVRGERLALMELRHESGDDVFHRVATVEIDDTARISRISLFEVGSLLEAAQYLGSRWLEVDRPEHQASIEVSLDFPYADASGDWGHLADDCAFVDHRPLSFGRGDKAWMVEMSKSREGLEGTRLNPRILGWNERGTFATLATWIKSKAGELVQGATPGIGVRQMTAGRVSAIEVFPDDDLDSARSRFEELTAEPPPAMEHEPWNAADALARRVLHAYAGGEIDSAAHDLDPTVRIESRRFAGATHSGTADKDESLSRLRDRPVFPESTDLHLDTFATRGDRLVLLRAEYRTTGDADGPTIDMLILVRLTADGLADLGVAWETDDLEQAIAELDRLYLEQDPGPEMAVTLRGWTEVYDVPRTGFTAAVGERMMLNLDSDLRMVDHRAIGWPEQDFDAFRERIRSLVDLDAELLFVVARVRRVDGVLSFVELVMTVTSREGAVQTDRNLLVAETNPESGLIVRNDQFGADDIDAAEEFFDARATELAAIDSVGNTASWLSNLAHTWARATAWERAGSLFADDVVIDDDVGAVLHSGREALADAGTAAGVGFVARDRRVLAVRGEQLALMEWRDDERDGGPFRRFVVVELNRRAEFTRIRLFDWTIDGLKAAADHLDDRYGAIEDLCDVEQLSVEFVHAFRHRDHVRLGTLLQEHYTVIDHRPLAFVEFDRASWLELFEQPEAVPVATVVGRLLDTTDAGVAVRISQWVLSEDNLYEALPGHFVSLVEDGLIVRNEGLPPDDPQAAIARLAELTGAAAQRSEQEPWNDADRRSRQALSDFEHDVEVWRGTLAPDIEYHDMRPLVGGTFRGPEQVEEAFAPGFMRQIDVETIATRGDRLVLFRSLMSTTGGGADAGIEMEFLILHRWSKSGLLELTNLFDPDDLESAVAELDSLYLDSGPGPAMYATMRGMRQRLDAFASNEPTDPTALLDPDFEFVDHRKLGWPTLDRETNRKRSESMSEFVDRFVFLTRIHRAEGPVQLFELEARIAHESGARYTPRNLLLNCMNPLTGLSRRNEQFEIDDLEGAFARFDELLDEVVAGGLTNTSANLTAFAHSMMRSDRWEVALDSLAESVVVTQHDGEVVASGRDELSHPEVARRVGFGARDRKVLGVRGDHLTLMEWRDDDLGGSPFRELAVVELNERAELSRITQFDWNEDSLIAAANLLDDRWIELDGIDETVAESPALEAWRALSRHDGRRLFELMSDDADIWDRRPLGWPRMGKAEWFDATNKVQDLRGVGVIGRILSISDTALVHALSHWEFSDSGDLTEMRPGIYMTTSRDGLIDLVEAFPPDDADVALMRLAELTSEQPPTARSTDDEPWNEADHLTRRLVGRLAARDVGRYAENLADDVVLDDRRELIQSIHRGRDEVMAVSAPGIYRPDQELVADVETIASRGDGFALHRCEIRVVDEHDGPTMAWLSVTAWDDSRLTRAVLFDPDDYLGAVSELDRMFLDRCNDDSQRLLITELGASYRAISARDLQQVMDLGDPGFTMADHRGIGWGEVDADGFRARIRSIMDLDADLASFVIRSHRGNVHAFMAEGCHRVKLASGAVQVERHLLVASLDAESGMVKQMDFFGIEQFDEAVALHARLTEQIVAEAHLVNITVVLANRVNTFARLERSEQFLDALSPDLLVEDACGTRLVTDTGVLLDLGVAMRLGFGVDSRRVLAIRGERLALVELRDPDVDGEPFHRFVVEETNLVHQIVRIALYEPHELAEAADDFDRRGLALDDRGHEETLALIVRNTRAFRHLDVDASADTIAADYTFVDHRSMGYPSLGKDDFLATYETVGDAHGVVIETEDGHVGPSGLVAPIINLSVSAGGELVENQVAVAMVLVRDGLVANVEFFATDDVTAAIARLDELSAG